MKYYYKIFNQNIKSDLLIPEAIKSQDEITVDVDVEWGEPPEWVLDRILEGHHDYIEEKVMWFYLKGLVLFYVENGNHIIIYKESKDLSNLVIRSYLLGSAMALIAIQKGYIPIHGGTVTLNDQAVIISGRSGSGKSTISFELYQKGYNFLADDLSLVKVIDDTCYVYPGYPQQKLCRDMIERNNLNKDELIYIDENRDKFARILKNNVMNNPVIPKCMIELQASSDTQEVEWIEVKGVDKLYQLFGNIYRGEVFERLGNDPLRYKEFFKVASKFKMYRIMRPKKGYYINEMTDIIDRIMLEHN